MSQTAYNQSLSVGRAGMLADNRDRKVESKVSPTDDVPAGCGVTQGTLDREVVLPSSAVGVTAQGRFKGICLVNLSTENIREAATPAHYPHGEPLSILEKGCVWVTVEEAVTPLSSVYCRFANGNADNTQVQKGAFRASADAAGAIAQVTTVTPTAVNSLIYSMEIRGADGVTVIATAEYLADGSATATEICDGLRTALGTVPGIAKSGTATLILTASVAGVPFTVVNTGDGVLTPVTGTANVVGTATAALVPNARWVTTQAVVGGLAQLELT